MRQHFAEKIALVTGGSSGLGLALARQLAGQGAHTWLAARSPENLAQALESVQAARQREAQICAAVPTDVTDPAQVQALLKQIEQAQATPDFVFNCAGFAQPGYFHAQDPAVSRWMMEVNYFGLAQVTQAVLPGMLRRGSGHIVNISSESGFLGLVGYAGYCASKFAVCGFSEALRMEVKSRGVRVSLVCPPDIDTPQLEYERRFQPPEAQALGPLRSVMTAEAVAREILAGVARNRYLILPGFDSKLIYRLTRLAGGATYPLFDWIHAILWKRWQKTHLSNQRS